MTLRTASRSLPFTIITMGTIAACHCWLFEAESGAMVTSVLRPGKRPTGVENAMIMKRVLHVLRQHWPQAHRVVLKAEVLAGNGLPR